MGSEGSAVRLLGYAMVGVVAFGGIGTALVAAAVPPEQSRLVILFMPLVAITSLGMTFAWAGFALLAFIRTRFQKFQ